MIDQNRLQSSLAAAKDSFQSQADSLGGAVLQSLVMTGLSSSSVICRSDISDSESLA